MTWHMAQNIQEWAPMTSNPTVHLYVEKQADGSLNPKSSWNVRQEMQGHIQSSMKTGIAGIMQQSANKRNEAEMAAANERARQFAAANNAPQ